MADFCLVDVFGTRPFSGNPLPVLFDADALSDAEMQRITRWFGFSETTFLVAPTEPGADYRVRIFTLDRELPFAGHPTLGTCHAWLSAGNNPSGATIVQQCGAGLVEIRAADELAFAAPPLIRSRRGRRGRGGGARGVPRHRARRDRRDAMGRQWARLGRGDAGQRRGGPRDQAARHRQPPLRCRRRRAAFVGRGGLRGARLVQRPPRGDHRGPDHRQPQRLAGAMADRERPLHRALCRAAGHRDRARGARHGRPGCMPARSGSAGRR